MDRVEMEGPNILSNRTIRTVNNPMDFDEQYQENFIVMSPKNLDFGELVKLQQEAFSEIIEKTGTSYLFSEDYYRWKYSPPAGDARIALLRDSAGLVAANSMYPLDILANGEKIRGWQSCDTATLLRGRGKGYFMKCIGALKDELESEDLFFGYPNRNSLPGLVKLGWSHHSDIRTWIRILPGGKTAGHHFIEKLEKFTAEQDIFSCELAARSKGAMLDRNSIYMNWRYKMHPLHEYEAYGWREGVRLLGVLVLRRAKISGKELAIVMETLALEPHVARGMLRFAAGWGRERGANYTLALNNTVKMMTGFLSAYIPVPMWVLPKRQVLMGAASGPSAKAIWNMPWHIQIGDWDVF